MLDLRWILETLPVGVWVAQVPSGEVTYANPEFRAIVGMDAVPGSTIVDAPATYRLFDRNGNPYPVDQLAFSRVVATGRATVVDGIVIHRADGRRVNVRSFAYPKHAEDGTLTHVVVAFIDITAEVKAELEREETQSRLALAVNHSPIAIWAADVNGVVTLSEGAGLESLGVKSGELVGKNLFQLYGDHSTIPAYLRRGLAGESFWYSVQLGAVTFDTWLTPLHDAAGAVVGIAGVSNDVSELRNLQARAIQDDRAVALGMLAASVAHEINNPLTYMLGQQELLRDALAKMDRAISALPESQRGTYEDLQVQVHKALEPVRTGTERIAAITRELRTFNRPSNRHTGLVDVRSVVDSVLKLVRKELEARAHLDLKLGETAPVLGDSPRLVQVVMNLVMNAMQALLGDSPETERIWIRTGNEEGLVVIEVADSGPGVPLADRERIFEPFVTTKGVGEGTGLGLFVCRNIVRDFSGRVLVSDRQGGGAVFRIELPAATVANIPETPTRTGASGEAVSAHILLIEDDALVADLLSRQLSIEGYRSSIELDARRALETIVSIGDTFDLIYCDLMMNGMTGMELAEALVARAPAQLRKVVFMTGGAFTPRARNFRESHPDQCVDKPFDILVETARRLNNPTSTAQS